MKISVSDQSDSVRFFRQFRQLMMAVLTDICSEFNLIIS